MIRDGELKIGDPLPAQRELAERLSVSRPSLREAISVLQAIGTLRTEPRRGTYVAEGQGRAAAKGWQFSRMYSPQDVYQFRFVTEGYAARLAAIHASEDQIDGLRRNLASFKGAVRDIDLVLSSHLDYEFHTLIMRASGNRAFLAVHEGHAAAMLASQRLPLYRREQLWEPIAEHANILQAISQRDPDSASYFMHVHISRAADRFGIRLSDVA